MLCKRVILFAVLLVSQQLYAKTDTVVVYERRVVYDTVRIYDTIRVKRAAPSTADVYLRPKQLDISMLHIDTLTHDLNIIVFSADSAAAFSINGIIDSETLKQLKSMKKLSFCSVMLFAFHSFVFAQTNVDFGITAGAGHWWATSTNSLVKPDYTPTAHAGIFVSKPLIKGLFVRTELSYQYQHQNGSYNVDTSCNCVSRPSIIDGQVLHAPVFDYPHASTSFHQLVVPLVLGYKVWKLEPAVGLEYSYRFAPGNAHLKAAHDAGLHASLRYNISQRFAASVTYYQGLSKSEEYLYHIVDSDHQLFETKTAMYQTRRLGLSVYYKLNAAKASE